MTKPIAEGVMPQLDPRLPAAISIQVWNLEHFKNLSFPAGRIEMAQALMSRYVSTLKPTDILIGEAVTALYMAAVVASQLGWLEEKLPKWEAFLERISAKTEKEPFVLLCIHILQEAASL